MKIVSKNDFKNLQYVLHVPFSFYQYQTIHAQKLEIVILKIILKKKPFIKKKKNYR